MAVSSEATLAGAPWTPFSKTATRCPAADGSPSFAASSAMAAAGSDTVFGTKEMTNPVHAYLTSLFSPTQCSSGRPCSEKIPAARWHGKAATAVRATCTQRTGNAQKQRSARAAWPRTQCVAGAEERDEDVAIDQPANGRVRRPDLAVRGRPGELRRVEQPGLHPGAVGVAAAELGPGPDGVHTLLHRHPACGGWRGNESLPKDR